MLHTELSIEYKKNILCFLKTAKLVSDFFAKKTKFKIERKQDISLSFQMSKVKKIYLSTPK